MSSPILEIPRRLVPAAIDIYQNISPEHLAIHKELRNQVDSIISLLALDLPQQELDWITDQCLLRYLRAHEWNINNALNSITNTLIWRNSSKPYDIPLSKVSAKLQNGQTIISGFGKNGSPIIIFKDFELHVENMIFNIETALKLCPTGIDSLIFIIDCSKLSLLSQPPLHIAKRAAQIFGEYYAEIVYKIIVVNPTWYLHPFYRIIKVFLPAATTRKVHFIGKGNAEGVSDTAGYSSILEHIDADQLFAYYGGDYSFEWDFKTYISSLSHSILNKSV